MVWVKFKPYSVIPFNSTVDFLTKADVYYYLLVLFDLCLVNVTDFGSQKSAFKAL